MFRPALRLLTVAAVAVGSVGGIGLLAGLAAPALAATGRRRRTTVDGSREPVPSSTGAQ